jgi:hypothetical protein
VQPAAAAAAIRSTLFDTHNSAAIAQLELAVHGTDTTADDETPSPPSLGNVVTT